MVGRGLIGHNLRPMDDHPPGRLRTLPIAVFPDQQTGQLQCVNPGQAMAITHFHFSLPRTLCCAFPWLGGLRLHRRFELPGNRGAPWAASRSDHYWVDQPGISAVFSDKACLGFVSVSNRISCLPIPISASNVVDRWRVTADPIRCDPSGDRAARSSPTFTD
jgi:hypothetical protein